MGQLVKYKNLAKWSIYRRTNLPFDISLFQALYDSFLK